MKFIFSTMVLITWVSYSDAQINCSQRLLDMDAAVAKILLVFDPSMRPMKNANELNSNFCQPYKGWIKIVSDYKVCLKNFQKTVFGIIIYNMKKNGDVFCRTPEIRNDNYNHTECFTQELSPKVKKVLNKLTVVVEYVADRPNLDHMIPGLCCGFHRLMGDLESEIGKICDPITKRQTGKFIREIVEANIADALDLMCGNFGSLAQCQLKAPEILNEINIKMDENFPLYNHTAFTGLLRFIEKMDSKVNVKDEPSV